MIIATVRVFATCAATLKTTLFLLWHIHSIRSQDSITVLLSQCYSDGEEVK